MPFSGRQALEPANDPGLPAVGIQEHLDGVADDDADAVEAHFTGQVADHRLVLLSSCLRRGFGRQVRTFLINEDAKVSVRQRFQHGGSCNVALCRDRR